MSLFLFLAISLLLTKFGDTSGLIDAPISHTGTTNIAGFIESGELCFVSDSISLKENVVIDKKKRKFHLLYDDVCYAVAGHLVMDDTYLTRLYQSFDVTKYKLTIGEDSRNVMNIYYILMEMVQGLRKNKSVLKRDMIPSFLLGAMNKENGVHLFEVVQYQVREVSFGSIGK